MSLLPAPVQPGDLVQGRRDPVRTTLLASARPLPPGLEWRKGLSWRTVSCVEPVMQDFCSTAETIPSGTGSETFDPLQVRQTGVCSTLSSFDVEEVARQRLAATTEWSLGREMATGAATGNPALNTDGTDLGDFGTDISSAISCLERAALDATFGGVVWLHASIKAAHMLAANNLLFGREDGSRWTATGHPVVISPGYPDANTGANLWATGEVWAATEPPEVLLESWRRGNSDEAFAQRLGIVLFDPCAVVRARVTTDDCANP